MVYLHENREEFTNAVNLASEYFHILPIIAEKDYYVTMILRELSGASEFYCVQRWLRHFPNVIRQSSVFLRTLTLQ